MALMLAIETAWTEDTTDLADTILKVIRQAEINKENDKSTTESVNTFAVGSSEPHGVHAQHKNA